MCSSCNNILPCVSTYIRRGILSSSKMCLCVYWKLSVVMITGDPYWSSVLYKHSEYDHERRRAAGSADASHSGGAWVLLVAFEIVVRPWGWWWCRSQKVSIGMSGIGAGPLENAATFCLLTLRPPVYFSRPHERAQCFTCNPGLGYSRQQNPLLKLLLFLCSNQ